MPDGLEYVSRFVLAGEHTDAINSVAISPAANYVASGGTDQKLVIWSLECGRALHRIVTRSEILSIIWPGEPSRIICGTQDGTIITVIFDGHEISVSGFMAHTNGVECLAFNKYTEAARQLASGAHDIVRVWTSTNDDLRWECGEPLPSPQSGPYDGGPAIVTSLQWLSGPRHFDRLIVAYLYHGIQCFECTAGAPPHVLWSIHLPLCGPCSAGPDNKALVICTITKGFNVYAMPSGLPKFTIPVPKEGPAMLLPVKHITGGLMLLIGSPVGKVRLLDAETGDHIQSLRSEHAQVIQCLDASYQKLRSKSSNSFTFDQQPEDNFIVATGSSDMGVPNVVEIWSTRELVFE